MDAFGDQADCYHKQKSKNGICKKCGTDTTKREEDKK